MLTKAVGSYLELRRACGFELRIAGSQLRSFAKFAELRGDRYVRSSTACQWARMGRSRLFRARRLDDVIRFARFVHAENDRHEVPQAVFGSHFLPRPSLECFDGEQDAYRWLEAQIRPRRGDEAC